MKKTFHKPGRNIIGSAVREIRLSQRTAVSQEDLAGRMAARGVSIDRTAGARIERGQRYVLDYEVVALARSVRVSVERLFRRS